MPDIEPTHRCFDDALDFISTLLRDEPWQAFDTLVVLVHGECLGTEPPHVDEPYTHAWVEDGARVWDSGMLDGQRVYLEVERAEFYAARRVQRTVPYTNPADAIREPAQRALWPVGRRAARPLRSRRARHGPHQHERTMTGSTFVIADDGSRIICKLCDAVSHHPVDIAERYCARCHLFHDAIALARSQLRRGGAHKCREWLTARGYCALCGFPIALAKR